MPATFQVRVYDRYQLVYSCEFDKAVELGRQYTGDPGLYSKKLVDGRWRVIVAGHDENTISRSHALIRPLTPGVVGLTNLSKKIPIRLQDGSEVGPESTRELAIPVVLTLGHKTVRVQGTEAEASNLQHLPEATAPPGAFSVARSDFKTLPLDKFDGVDVERTLLWLRGAMQVLQSAATGSSFFEDAARSLVELVGLDTGLVLLWDEVEDWKEKAVQRAPGMVVDPEWVPSRSVLNRVRDQKRTFWQAAGGTAQEASSLVGVKAVVAAPILDRNGQVIGALYGDRRQDGLSGADAQISKLEAMLVELLAGGVASGLARVEMERDALAAKVRFEQFFTPELAGELASNHDMLQGRDMEVSILFADIRGFSGISERLGPAGTVEWINDVMEALSDCVQEHGGVLVDYIGDELMAMWGAPKEQPDHARRACRAGLDMLAKLDELNQRWHDRLKVQMGLGIGVNTGMARVGNTGSRRKFKYGPLGPTVNLASRVQGATKYLKTRLLITGATRAQLDETFEVRRVAKVSVVNIVEPVALYDLARPGETDWAPCREGYESALEQFEAGQFREAARLLGRLLTDHQGDGPSMVLLYRAVNFIVEEPADFSPIWKLPGK
ncbi:MAG TPA: adenylate/guanylate cyclase domain-containing protein [Isosphaeraceae bacterium]|jgi:adenylate cyclase|nr:adenylate/guanylate cyclase domain-containing protein [Isosphaeraceae bacterium]